MLEIHDGRKDLFQWDLGRRLIVADADCNEIHFYNKTENSPLTCRIYEENGERLVNVPNVLLQEAMPITAYAYLEDETKSYTKKKTVLRVFPRPKPAEYVYTETEVISYNSLNKRVTDLEGEGLANAVAAYLEKNPGNSVLYTEQKLGEDQKQQARENIGAANAEDIISGGGLTTEEKNIIFSLFRDAAYAKPLTGAIEQLAELWGISLVWQKVVTLEKILIGYGLAAAENEVNGEMKYTRAVANRASYLDFITVKGGATYKFEWGGSAESVICIEAYNTRVMQRVSDHLAFSDADRWSSGWNNSQTTGCQFTIPAEFNGLPVVAMRFTFNTSAPPTGDITITEVVE